MLREAAAGQLECLPTHALWVISFNVFQWVTVTVSDCSPGPGFISGPGGESCVLQGKIATRKK